MTNHETLTETYKNEYSGFKGVKIFEIITRGPMVWQKTKHKNQTITTTTKKNPATFTLSQELKSLIGVVSRTLHRLPFDRSWEHGEILKRECEIQVIGTKGWRNSQGNPSYLDS